MNIPLYVAAIILAVLFFVAYKLNLPEGWPRAVAFVVIALVGVGMVLLSKKSLNDKAGRK